ncbi:Cif family virulence factor [Kineosporia babensis]|uniref:SnoaL-like domain-containing protein n=1 Tax=Kineosporia babensis TaxID=499548 RepID=A0A9X1ND43_9ACTN|nr:hypothetical protein [Kineosporia babensis]MCD5311903.1 hypothetical protein [Kineosporia babensis]
MSATENVSAIVADLHSRWVFGWERNEGDPPFDFPATFGDFYDFAGSGVRLYDDYDPQHRVATSAAGYGEIFTPAFNAMLYARHAIDSAPQVVAGSELAASTLVFVARIATAQAVTDIRTTSSLVWRRTPQGWRIVREHNSTQVLEPGALDGRLPL